MPRTVWISLGLHALAVCLVVLALATARPPRVKPPGTRRGTVAMLYFAPGGAKAAAARAVAKPKGQGLLPRPAPVERRKPAETSAPAAAEDQSAFGSGDIQMALLTYAPDPQPDLSTLPAGAEGDVVLDVVIDDHGRVERVTLVKGLGGAVDQTVIATAERWTFSPATKDGVAVESSQQLLFHYARS